MEQAARELVEEVHSQNRTWQKTLAFYIDELNILLERVEEISNKNTSLTVREEIDVLLNRMISLRMEIDKLQKQIDLNEEKAIKYQNLHLKRVDHIATEVYNGLKTEMDVFEKIYIDCKKDLMTFLSKWM